MKTAIKAIAATILFSALHAGLTLGLHAWTFAAGMSGNSTGDFTAYLLFALAMPLLLPVFLFVQDLSSGVYLSFALNSLIWGITIACLLHYLRKRKLRAKEKAVEHSL